MGDGGGVRGEEPRVEAPDPAGRGDRARDQEQPGRIGQEASIGKRLPRAGQCRHRAIDLAPETKTGFLAGLADRGDRERTRARWRDLRAALQEVCFKRFGDGCGHRNAAVGLVDAAAGKDEFAGHEHHLVVALADQDLWRCGAAIDQDQRGGIDRAAIGVMVGFFLRYSRFRSWRAATRLLVVVVQANGLWFRVLLVKSMHAQRPLHPDHGALDRLQQRQGGDQGQRQIDRELKRQPGASSWFRSTARAAPRCGRR